jgi:hypothetical protein
MNEREKVVMMRVLLSFVKDIHDGKSTPGPYAIQQRLRLYTESTERLLKEKT